MGMFKKDETGVETATSYISSSDAGGPKSVIGKTLFIKGEIISDEEVLIEGKIEGKIKINHRVIIGENGIVNADIDAKEVIIKGIVTGNVTCSDKIEIVPNGKLIGNINSNKVALAEGAIFKGNIEMKTEEEEVVEAEVVDEEEEEKQDKEEEKKETEEAQEETPKKKNKKA